MCPLPDLIKISKLAAQDKHKIYKANWKKSYLKKRANANSNKPKN